MENKILIQLLLPLYDEKGIKFPAILYATVKKELIEKFGGLTAYTRSPATGLWKEPGEKVVHDEIIIYEAIADTMDESFWKSYKKVLEKRFKQDEIMIKGTEVRVVG